MREIQDLLVNETINFIDALVRSAKVQVDDRTIDWEVSKTRKEGNTLRKYVYLDDSVQGLLKRAALLDSQGRELYVKDLNFKKGEDGFMIAFPIMQTVEVLR